MNKPPIFNGEEFTIWKTRMEIVIYVIDFYLWDRVQDGPFIPNHFINGELVNKTK